MGSSEFAVVGQEHHDRVVQHLPGLEKRDQSAEVRIEILDHGVLAFAIQNCRLVLFRVSYLEVVGQGDIAGLPGFLQFLRGFERFSRWFDRNDHAKRLFVVSLLKIFHAQIEQPVRLIAGNPVRRWIVVLEVARVERVIAQFEAKPRLPAALAYD